MSAFTADQYIGGNFTWFTGVVEDRNDPEQMGRVRVRCFGFHTENRGLIPTADLPWASVLMPTTASGVSGVGSSHHGLVTGSWVVGFFRDGPSAQDPIIMGSIQAAPSSAAVAGKGFNDPNGQYPKYTGEPDVNKRAREINTTPRKSISASGGTSTVDGKDKLVIITEPADQYASKYPRNHVYESESGHILEFDDTLGMERINIEHKSGSFIELHRNGDIRVRSLKEKWESSVKWNLFVEGDTNVIVGGNLYGAVKGDTNISCDQNVTVSAAKDMNLGAIGDVNITGYDVKVNSSPDGRIDLNYEPEIIEVDLTTFVYGDPIFASPGGGGTAGASPGGTYVGTATEFATQLSKDEIPTAAYSARKELGSVSSKYESNGKPDAIGWDTTGGASYGEYQIATKTGTFNNFMKFLKLRGYTNMYDKLSAAGAPMAAYSLKLDEDQLKTDPPTISVSTIRSNVQSTNFAKVWYGLAAEDPDFKSAQHAFIQATHYDILANTVKSKTGIDINSGKYSLGIQNAIWSTAVQHGPSTSVINCLSGLGDKPESDLVTAIYTERQNVGKWFSKSTDSVKASVLKRFKRELRDCLNSIEKLEGFTPNTPSVITGKTSIPSPDNTDQSNYTTTVVYDTKTIAPSPIADAEITTAIAEAESRLPGEIAEAQKEIASSNLPDDVKKEFGSALSGISTINFSSLLSTPLGGIESLGKSNGLTNLSNLGSKINNGIISLQDPNAAPYTGNDNIIRARLGLPLVDENGNVLETT